MNKPKIGFYWCASCGGCEEAIVDLHEKILDVVEKVDIVFWPCAMDFKYSDVENMKDGEMAVCFINGAIRTDEQEHMAKLLRQKAQLIVSFGACSQIGGIPGLGNFWDRETIFRSSYLDKCPSIDNPQNTIPLKECEVPEGKLTLPGFHDDVKATDQVIEVDYYLPGCSPAPHLTLNAIMTILRGELPAKGSVLGPSKALCDTCPRNDTKPEKLSIKEFKRVSEVMLDPEKCFLTQGVICMGPVTRSGCGDDGEGRCIKANMPCRGCYGPIDGVIDVGAKMISAIGSIAGLDGEEEIPEAMTKRLMDSIVDPAGLFYRFSLAKSLLGRRTMPQRNKEQ